MGITFWHDKVWWNEKKNSENWQFCQDSLLLQHKKLKVSMDGWSAQICRVVMSKVNIAFYIYVSLIQWSEFLVFQNLDICWCFEKNILVHGNTFANNGWDMELIVKLVNTFLFASFLAYTQSVLEFGITSTRLVYFTIFFVSLQTILPCLSAYFHSLTCYASPGACHHLLPHFSLTYICHVCVTVPRKG